MLEQVVIWQGSVESPDLLGVSLVFTWRSAVIVLNSKQVLSVSFEGNRRNVSHAGGQPHNRNSMKSIHEIFGSWGDWRGETQCKELNCEMNVYERVYRIRENCKKKKTKCFDFRCLEKVTLVCRPRKKKVLLFGQSPGFLCPFFCTFFLLSFMFISWELWSDEP